MNNHQCSFVRFRAIPSACIANSELEGGIPNANPTFQAEPIRVLPFDMDVDGPTTIQSQLKKRGIEKMTHPETTRKRLRTADTHWPAIVVSSCNNDHHHASSQRHALSIDLIVSHIIGYLPWKQQIVSCSRVSKQWNQACLTAPARVLLLPTKNCLPRVLEPCHIERSLNEMSWKTFSQISDTKILSKITRLDIWGDLDWQKKNKNVQRQHQISNLGQLEELNLRYVSLDALLEIFPESKHPRFVHLTKLVIKEWGSRNARSTTRINEESRGLLRQRILFHAPNLLILTASV